MAPNIESIPPAYWLVHRPRKGHFCHKVTKISGHSECEKGKTSSRSTSFSDPKPQTAWAQLAWGWWPPLVTKAFLWQIQG